MVAQVGSALVDRTETSEETPADAQEAAKAVVVPLQPAVDCTTAQMAAAATKVVGKQMVVAGPACSHRKGPCRTSVFGRLACG